MIQLRLTHNQLECMLLTIAMLRVVSMVSPEVVWLQLMKRSVLCLIRLQKEAQTVSLRQQQPRRSSRQALTEAQTLAGLGALTHSRRAVMQAEQRSGLLVHRSCLRQLQRSLWLISAAQLIHLMQLTPEGLI